MRVCFISDCAEMERREGESEVARAELVGGGKVRVHFAGCKLIGDKESAKDLVFALCGVLGLLAVEDEDIKAMVRAIDETMEPKESIALKGGVKIPIAGTTTDNNNFVGYTGDSIPTEKLFEMNKEFKQKHP